MRLLGLLGCIVSLWAVWTASAQESFSADDGFFSFTIPDGWTSTAIPDGLSLSTESSDVMVYLVTRVADSANDAIVPALEQVGVTYGALASETDAPLPNGVWRQHIYSNGGDLALGLSQVKEGRALVMIVAGEQAEIQTMNPQILSILTSIQVGEVSLPPYVDTESFTEREVFFGEDPYVMNGTLTVPLGESRFPAVVIVHGSGPSDRNGTLGSLAAYRDIAQGLASQGIIVLRYDKRTLTYGADIPLDNTFTVDTESTDDAVMAVEFLRNQTEVDPDKIFVLGHSQGASLTPRIIQRSDVAGGIMLAAATRPFSELVREQIAYISEVNPDAMVSPAIVGLQTVVDNFDKVASGADYVDVFGAQGNYFESLNAINPLITAQEVDVPLLILQGERDYQVTMTDFSLWQAAYGDNDSVTLMSYPTLNHQFMSQGDLTRLSIPQDYESPDFVSAEVIQDISDWIQAIE